MAQVTPVPEGYHSVTPYLVVDGASKAIDFYKRAFGAVERFRMPAPDDKVGHAEIQIGDSVIMLSDPFPEMGSSAPSGPSASSGLMLYVADVDALFKQAVDAGATVTMPLDNQFWGDRYGKAPRSLRPLLAPRDARRGRLTGRDDEARGGGVRGRERIAQRLCEAPASPQVIDDRDDLRRRVRRDRVDDEALSIGSDGVIQSKRRQHWRRARLK